MKFKKLFWIGVLILPLFACNDSDEILLTESNIKMDFPLTFNETEVNLKSSYLFSGNANFCLGTKQNVKNCPTKILSVKSGSGATLTIPFAGDKSSVSNLTFNWGYAAKSMENFNMQESIELNIAEASLLENSLSFDLDKILLPLIDKVSANPNSYFKIEITGNSDLDLAPGANIDIPIMIEHENLSIRFGVF